MVKGMVDVDIRGELIAEVEQMDLETTMTFVEIKEMDKKDAASVGLPFPVPEVNLWRQPEEVVESISVIVMHSTGRKRQQKPMPGQGVWKRVCVQVGNPEAVRNENKC